MAALLNVQLGGQARKVSRSSLNILLLAGLLVGAQAAIPVHAIGTVRFAAPGGMAVGACSSWLNACHLQYAISVAGSGDQVWVKQGTHVPIGLRDDSFELKNGVGIYGGFTGTETLLAQRDPAAHVTTLSGDIGIAGDITDNSYHVVVGDGTDTTAVLDGFAVTSGNADSSGGTYTELGGGLFILPGAATLTNLVFTENTAVFGGGFFTQSTNPVLTNVEFDNNHATDSGGGMYANGSTAVLTNVTFSSNTAVGSGGGMYNTNSSPYLTNVTMTGNGAAYGGGMYNFSGSYPLITNTTFSGNTASLGGAMLNVAVGSPSIYSSLFWNNGDEIYDADPFSTPTLKDDIVAGGCPAYGSCTNVMNADPLLQPLADNGGFTQTMALSPLSPAKDAGGVNEPCAADDQRGILRPQGPACDMGSYEYDGVETTLTYRSVGTQDGWVLESTETSGSGGSLDAAASQFNLGDDAANKQYRGILSFDTSSLPDGAVITAVTLKIKKTGLVGTNPFSSLGDIIVDIKNGSFSSNPALQKTDFKALATKNYVAKFLNAPVSNWYSTALGASSYGYINKTGTTQFRLRFATDDNNNVLANYLKFGSGNAVTTSRPRLIVTYWP